MTVRVYAGGAPERRALEAWRNVSGGARRFTECRWPILLRKQRKRCYLCGEPMDLSNHGRGRNLLAWTYEHVFPRAAGGRDLSNILLAHRSCNDVKHSRWPYPCEVIYLFAVYAEPYDAKAMRLARTYHLVAKNNRRRWALDQANA